MNNVSATILTCNTAFLGQAVLAAQKGGAASLHVDITDGKYCGNYSFGPKTIADLKEVVDIPVEVHFELYDPQYYIDIMAEAGADIITIQSDSCPAPIRTLQRIRALGKQAGLGFSPACGLEMLPYLAPHIDHLILLAVEPGFGGQKLQESIYQKIRDAREILAKAGADDVVISVDGGLRDENVEKLLRCGVNRLIVGSAVFSHNRITEEEIQEGIQFYKNHPAWNA